MEDNLGWGLLLGAACAVAVFGAVVMVATQGEESSYDRIGKSKDEDEFLRIRG
jgi:hypothetical protein